MDRLCCILPSSLRHLTTEIMPSDEHLDWKTSDMVQITLENSLDSIPTGLSDLLSMCISIRSLHRLDQYPWYTAQNFFEAAGLQLTLRHNDIGPGDTLYAYVPVIRNPIKQVDDAESIEEWEALI